MKCLWIIIVIWFYQFSALASAFFIKEKIMSMVTERQMQLYDRVKTLITSFCQEQDISLVEVSGVLTVILHEVNETIANIDYGDDGDEDQVAHDVI